MIGYAAGVAAEQGLDQYLWLMAVISMNLGLLNFLPVPILDGGLLVFFTLELFKRRPPSPRARQIATNVGLVVVVALMVLALRNDVVRFLLAAVDSQTPAMPDLFLCLDTSTPTARVAILDGDGRRPLRGGGDRGAALQPRVAAVRGGAARGRRSRPRTSPASPAAAGRAASPGCASGSPR